eukprot:243843-Rhodomonas_salina.3
MSECAVLAVTAVRAGRRMVSRVPAVGQPSSKGQNVSSCLPGPSSSFLPHLLSPPHSPTFVTNYFRLTPQAHEFQEGSVSSDASHAPGRTSRPRPSRSSRATSWSRQRCWRVTARALL